eukprot:5732723-Amphidinium_carterae.2
MVAPAMDWDRRGVWRHQMGIHLQTVVRLLQQLLLGQPHISPCSNCCNHDRPYMKIIRTRLAWEEGSNSASGTFGVDFPFWNCGFRDASQAQLPGKTLC